MLGFRTRRNGCQRPDGLGAPRRGNLHCRPLDPGRGNQGGDSSESSLLCSGPPQNPSEPSGGRVAGSQRTWQFPGGWGSAPGHSPARRSLRSGRSGLHRLRWERAGAWEGRPPHPHLRPRGECPDRLGTAPSLPGRGTRGRAGPREAGSRGAPRLKPRPEPGGEAAGGAGRAGVSGGRSCSRTARRRLGAARREPRGAGGRGTPCLAACASGRRPARDGASSMSSGYSSLEEDAEDFFFTARTSFFRRAPQGKPRAGQEVSGTRGGRSSRRS